MTKDEYLSPIALARQASALTIADAAWITGMSVAGYQLMEEHPMGMSIGELCALCMELNEDGREIMGGWMRSFFGLT